MKGIIFDVDGTLWDSTREVAVAWNKVLQDEMEGHEILTAEGLQKEFGKPMDAIAESLFPEMSEKDRMELLGKMMAYENELVAVGPCVIYNGVPETIKALSKKYPLYIVSNCQDGYIEAFLKNSGLGGYFKDFTCPAYTGRLKGENIRIIMERNGLDEALSLRSGVRHPFHEISSSHRPLFPSQARKGSGRYCHFLQCGRNIWRKHHTHLQRN